MRILATLAALALAACAAATPVAAQSSEPIVRWVKPSAADARVTRFDEAHYITFRADVAADAPLVVYMPGTGGQPSFTTAIGDAAAEQGYRVIVLEYNTTPAVVQLCVPDPDPTCSAGFRARRIYGDTRYAGIDDAAHETIVARLTALLSHLARTYPNEHWDRYLAGDAPNWQNIIVSGLSQGAGMAAYIAKRERVNRVVLFSSPFDFQNVGGAQVIAEWVDDPSATPPERWYGAYHRREATAALLAQSYATLPLLADHIRVFDLDVDPNVANPNGPNPFHPSTARDTRYAEEWRFLFGSAR